MHLQFWMIDAEKSGVDAHPQEVLRDLGITYQHATPQSIGDQWWFWNCENVPKKLPAFITELKISDPMEYVGHGLWTKKAEQIRDYKKVSRNNNITVLVNNEEISYTADSLSWKDEFGEYMGE